MEKGTWIVEISKSELSLNLKAAAVRVAAGQPVEQREADMLIAKGWLAKRECGPLLLVPDSAEERGIK